MPKRYPSVEEKRAQSYERMKSAEKEIGRSARFRPEPNNMAAGPCDGCLEISKRLYLADDAPLMPLDACPHPDQCVGHYRLEIDYSRF